MADRAPVADRASDGGLAVRVRALLADAIEVYRDQPAGRRLVAVANSLDEPLRVAIAGRVKAGKSTLLNALVARRVAATDAGECTRVVTWYVPGSQPQAWAYPYAGQPYPLPAIDDADAVTVDLRGLRADDLDHLRIELPDNWLTGMTLIDTPGIGSLTEASGRRTRRFLSGDADDPDGGQPGGGDVDAVLYLLRHLHLCDVDLLQLFHDAQYSRTTPINAVGVLSRADEIGGGGPDAMLQADRVAAGYRRDPRIRSLMHSVLPVAGLLAETGVGLTAEEYRQLTTLAGLEPARATPMLLSATRFVTVEPAGGIPSAARLRLLRRLGMYGLRLALDALRSGQRRVDRAGLAALLVDASGVPELRRLLLTQFAQRRDALKADRALRAIEAVTVDDGHSSAQLLRQRVERLRASAHELVEIRLLAALRTGQIPASADQLSTMERLLGGAGTALAARLGLPSTANTANTVDTVDTVDTADPVNGVDEAEVRAEISRQHAQWQRIAHHPLTDPALARAAAALVRSCEGLAATLPGTRRREAPREA